MQILMWVSVILILSILNKQSRNISKQYKSRKLYLKEIISQANKKIVLLIVIIKINLIIINKNQYQ
jgi:hypothetical protein